MATIKLFGYLGKQALPEQEDFQQVLRKQGVSYEERDIPGIGTFTALADLRGQLSQKFGMSNLVARKHGKMQVKSTTTLPGLL